MSRGQFLSEEAPEGAQAYMDGLYYKIGLRGRPFVWRGKEWVLSTRTAKEVRMHQLRYGLARIED